MEDLAFVDILKGETELDEPLHYCLFSEMLILLAHLLYVVGKVSHCMK